MNDTVRDAIIRFTDSHPGVNGVHPAGVPGLAFVRGDCTTPLQHQFYEPALIVVVQGAKDVMIGDACFSYTAGQYLVLGVGLPVLASITAATDAKPYLAVALTIDLRVINDLRDEIGRGSELPPAPSRLGLVVGNLDAHQNDAVARLCDLVASPDALRVLYPAIRRELYYWTLTGPNGGEISRLATPDSHTQRVADAINVMRGAFAETVSIERLAAIAHMSPSSFHQHFKAATSMSPLQYQKQLRLLEARRLMLAEGEDATRAAYHVGYESASQFSREYARMFGAPPRRDVAGMRAAL